MAENAGAEPPPQSGGSQPDGLKSIAPSGGQPTRWEDWVGRQERRRERISPFPAQAMAALLDHPSPDSLGEGAPIPGLWSWLYFLAPTPTAQIGPDGHPKRGGFLPPVPLARRMWAGSRCTLHGPLVIGADAEKQSEILAVKTKSGRSGDMVFVTVRHRVMSADVLAYEEEQDIVYMAIQERFSPPEPVPLPACAHRRTVTIDPVVLFRFSALTYNGHRIHYDRRYASEVERYPGLVVHGPLQALLLFDAALAWRPEGAPSAFAFRGVRPLFDFDRISLNASMRDDGGFDLFTAQDDNFVGMQAHLHWRA